MLSTNFGSDNTHLLSTAEQYGHQLVRVESMYTGDENNTVENSVQITYT